MVTFNKRNVLILTSRDLLKLSLNLEPSQPGSEVQDWVKCRDWLALPQVTPYSARTTKISKVASERELYNYLKVGGRGCRENFRESPTETPLLSLDYKSFLESSKSTCRLDHVNIYVLSCLYFPGIVTTQ